jgi:Tfp pilus assembly protein PilF
MTLALPTISACSSVPTRRKKDTVELTPTQKGKKALRDAIVAEEDGNFDRAERKYKKALSLRPDHRTTNLRYVHFLIDRGRPLDAVDIGGAYQQRNIGDPRSYHLLADAQIAAGEYRSAVKTLDTVIELDSEDPAAYEKRGRAHILSDQLVPGTKDIRKAVSLAPENVDYIVSLGSALHRGKKLKEAQRAQGRPEVGASAPDSRSRFARGVRGCRGTQSSSQGSSSVTQRRTRLLRARDHPEYAG